MTRYGKGIEHMFRSVKMWTTLSRQKDIYIRECLYPAWICSISMTRDKLQSRLCVYEMMSCTACGYRVPETNADYELRSHILSSARQKLCEIYHLPSEVLEQGLYIVVVTKSIFKLDYGASLVDIA